MHLAHGAAVLRVVTDTFNHPNLTLSTLHALETRSFVYTYTGSSIVPHPTLPRLRELTYLAVLPPQSSSFGLCCLAGKSHHH
ncbi:hypothetical protein B0H19DRAFT_1185619 [Mycena capillaripes]|nr:hypothetical protein B0H19DRAFT_1185619 [Mycena capillaripes]